MKNIKKSICILMLILVAFTMFAKKSSAMTAEELKDYICTGKGFEGTQLVIRDADKIKVEKFFKNNNMTDEQATKIKAIIDKAVAFMNEDGAMEPNAMSTNAKKKELFSYAEEAAAILGLTVTYDASEERLDIYRDGVKIESLNWGVTKTTLNTNSSNKAHATTEPSLKQTGTTNYIYVGIVGVILIAGIMLTVARKKISSAKI